MIIFHFCYLLAGDRSVTRFVFNKFYSFLNSLLSLVSSYMMIAFTYVETASQRLVFLVKGVLKICSKFTGEHPCRSVISIKLERHFTEITLHRGCSPVNLLHIFRIPFTINTYERLLLYKQKLPQ